METQKGPVKTTVLLKGDIWVSMLVWGSVNPNPLISDALSELWIWGLELG